MPTLNITEDTHRSLKRLTVDSQEIDKDANLQTTGDKAVLIGIAEMRERLEATLKRRKKK